MLFLSCEGLMVANNNSKRINDLYGAGLNNIYAGIGFVVGALLMIGFPLLSGFFGKYLLASASLSSPISALIVIAGLTISTVLNAIYFLRIAIIIFTKNNINTYKFIVSNNYKVTIILFVIVNIVFSFSYSGILDILRVGLELL